MDTQEIKQELAAIGDKVRVKYNEFMEECEVVEIAVQGVLVKSVNKLEMQWVPHRWLEKIEQAAPMTEAEALENHPALLVEPAPVTDTVPEPIPETPPAAQTVPVPVGVPEAVGSIDPATGLWVAPAAPDAGVL